MSLPAGARKGRLRRDCQYVARPPLRSDMKPAATLQAGETIQAIIGAACSNSPHRLGIFAVM